MDVVEATACAIGGLIEVEDTSPARKEGYRRREGTVGPAAAGTPPAYPPREWGIDYRLCW